MTSFGSGYNLPPGCYEHHLPGWDDPDEVDCPECGEEVIPVGCCPECGFDFDAEAREREEDAEIARAEAAAEARAIEAEERGEW